MITLHLKHDFGLLRSSPRAFQIVTLAAVILSFTVFSATAQNDQFSAEQVRHFEAKVRPLLAQHCFACHSGRAKILKAGLRLDTRAAAIEGGDSGPAILPGEPAESLLLKAVRYESLEMPPKGKLSGDEIAVLEQWIAHGAPWPESQMAAGGHPAGDPAYDWQRLRNEHWAFRPIESPRPPEVDDDRWPQENLDRFILARLEQVGLRPAPPADPRILVRRIFYDLVGLPPKPPEVDAFLEAAQVDYELAVNKLVDRLLGSPAYGERWGRHWLDVARYSDFDSGSNPLPHAWRYRDWVIDALNLDLPYDKFVRLQIAGDLIAGPDAAVATGLFALGPMYITDGGDPDGIAKSKGETLDDRIDTLTRGLLGLTVSCARCHDHKFDPIPTLDYYSLAGVFNNTHLGAEWDGKIADAQKKAGAHVLAEKGSGDMPVALRGNLRKPGELAPRRFLRILAGADPPRYSDGSGRRELAEAVAGPENPLTPRVIVNRVWMHHFGQALVRTPSNFGVLGEPPTHPRLLDWLATRLIASGWSLKDLHRTIIASAAYQMSSQFDAVAFQADGDNRLLWRMAPRRLDAESWRDTLLTVTGELEPVQGGLATDNPSSRRRTLYLKVSRNGDQFASDELLRLFDFPLMRATIAKRPTSIVPQQFLFLLNSPFMVARAEALARRLTAISEDDAERIATAYRLLFGRAPSPEEARLGLAYLQQEVPPSPEGPAAATGPPPLQRYAQILLSSNELMYVR